MEIVLGSIPTLSAYVTVTSSEVVPGTLMNGSDTDAEAVGTSGKADVLAEGDFQRCTSALRPREFRGGADAWACVENLGWFVCHFINTSSWLKSLGNN